MRHPDRAFSDDFWQQLVFNQHDAPGTLSQWQARRLRQHLNEDVQMVNKRGEVVLGDAERDYIVRTVPSIAQAIMGTSYTGRDEVGHTIYPEREGWI